MQFLAFLISICSIIGMFVAFLPFLGWMNWAVIPFALVGLVIGIIGTATAKRGRGLGIAAIALCGLAVLVGMLRLSLGGGIF